MTSEEKDLLFKDLCARLPYKVRCFCKWAKEVPNGTIGYIEEISSFLLDELEIMDKPEYNCQISEIKPYLRPLSSMTEDEKKELIQYAMIGDNGGEFIQWVEMLRAHEFVDWLNKHHFDYRGLIDKGLALEAPKGMYN